MSVFNRLCLLVLMSFSATTWADNFDQAEVENQAMVVLDEFMRSFSAMDPEAHIATYHFPHYRLARGTMSVTETAEDGIALHRQLFKQLPDSGWHKSIWIDRQITNISASKVHVETRFRRLRSDGSEIGTYNSLYILQKVDGRWGVKMRSSFL